MICHFCHKSAEIELRSHNISLCREHFINFFEKRVEKAIKKYKMFSKKESILLAVSGGKDSLVLWYILMNLGYNVSAYFINLGIPNFSKNAYQKIIAFKKNFGGTLLVDNIQEDIYNMDIKKVAKIYKTSTCSICGTFKRYKINQKALETDSIIATGHNLDDEVATLFANILHWRIPYIERQSPVLEKNKTLQKKVKPLVLLTDREIMTYAMFKGIDYFDEQCPYSFGATSRYYKKAITQLECNMPGTKLQFYTEFIRSKNYFCYQKQEEELTECEKCGYLTSTKLCKVCRIKNKIKDYSDKK